MRRAALLTLLLLAPAVVRAQDTTRAGVRIGIVYTPGMRPALAVVGPNSAAVDSVRAVLQSDLDYSDRFDMTVRPPAMDAPDPRTLAALGVDFAVTVTPAAGGGADVRLLEMRTGAERLHRTVDPGRRFAIHRAADAIVEAAFGQPGVAATRLLYVRNGRIWMVDADGRNAHELRTAGWPSLSPAWAPDARRFAYMAFVAAGQPIVIQDFATGERQVLPGTEYGLNITPVFSHDGRRLAFAHGTEAGTEIYLSEWSGGRWQTPVPITASRFADNLSPAWSPDGTRIAFISDRAQTPQLYVMNDDGTGQEVLGRFDYGATGTTSAPAWSPDGGLIAFHREVDGTPQIFVLDVASRAVRQVTGSGRNEDPAWAPDSRHLVFVSSRGGSRELWVVDLETGRLRSLTTGGGARLPDWSPRLTATEDRE